MDEALPHQPFDVALKRRQRARFAGATAAAAFLHDRVAEDVAERIAAVNRRFSSALALGGGASLVRALTAEPAAESRVGPVVSCDLAAARLAPPLAVAADPERLPFAPEAFQLIVSIFGLNWTNDLPGALVQLRAALAPDGLFIGAMFGGDTLIELRTALLEAELEIRGGAGPRVAPFADQRDLAGLLSRTGFALPVSDVDRVTVRYRDPLALVSDLRAMGETAALANRAPLPLTRAILARAFEIYAERFTDPDGRLRATFEIVVFTGWRPHDSQQKPLAPGSARTRLADALGSIEHSAGEKAGGV